MNVTKILQWTYYVLMGIVIVVGFIAFKKGTIEFTTMFALLALLVGLVATSESHDRNN